MELEEGDLYKEEISYSAAQVKQFAELSGDRNPLHLDSVYAATTPFKKTIVPGMLACTIFSKIVANNFPGPGAIFLENILSFKQPLYPGETYAAFIRVTNKRITSKGRTIYKMEFSINDLSDNILIEGTAIVLH